VSGGPAPAFRGRARAPMLTRFTPPEEPCVRQLQVNGSENELNNWAYYGLFAHPPCLRHAFLPNSWWVASDSPARRPRRRVSRSKVGYNIAISAKLAPLLLIKTEQIRQSLKRLTSILSRIPIVNGG